MPTNCLQWKHCFLIQPLKYMLSNRIKFHTQAFHTYRINLSPFTKDFRVWGATIETNTIYLQATFR